jgi:hypothetical protein
LKEDPNYQFHFDNLETENDGEIEIIDDDDTNIEFGDNGKIPLDFEDIREEEFEESIQNYRAELR